MPEFTNDQPHRLLRSREFEAYIGVSDRTVDAWVNAGMPVTRLPGGSRRYDLPACLAWMQDQQQDADTARTHGQLRRGDSA